MRSSIETIETTMRTTAMQLQSINDDKPADAGGLPELQAAEKS